MTEQAILTARQNNVEQDALFPTQDNTTTEIIEIPEKDPNIFPGTDKAPETGYTWGHAAGLIDSMVSSYNEAARVYADKLVDVDPKTEAQRTRLKEYLKSGKELIVNQAILAIDSNSLPEVNGVTKELNELEIQLEAENFVNERFRAAAEKRADERRKLAQQTAGIALGQTVEAPHIELTETDPSPETTSRFMEMISDWVPEPAQIAIDKALGRIGIGHMFAISQSLPIIPQQAVVEADAQALHDDLSGKELTVTIHSVKP